jgi:hypothetical protein
MVAATHGRSFWILDVTALRQLDPSSLHANVQFFKPAPAVQWVPQPAKGTTNREFIGDNRPPGAQFFYSLPKNADRVTITIYDLDGKKMQTLKGQTGAGLHRVSWPLRKLAPSKGKVAELIPTQAGTFQAVLNVDGQEIAQQIQVLNDPGLPPGVGIAEQLDE